MADSQSRMILNGAIPTYISATTCTHAAATNLFLFLIFYVSGNSFQLYQMPDLDG